MGDIIYTQKTIKELMAEMTRIRRQGGRVLANYFNQCSGCMEPLDSWIAENVCVFRWPDNGINRIYFYATDMDMLSSALSLTDPGDAIDFITKEKDFDDGAFLCAGYERYMEYGRFVSADPEKRKQFALLWGDEELRRQLFENKYGEPAVLADAEELERQLKGKFDPYEAHFYSLEKLKEHIQRGWVWVAKESGKIIAADLFEIQGQKCYGAYLYNDGPVEALSAMTAKCDFKLYEMGVEYFYCWMNLRNKRVLRYNGKYNGYVHDGTYDYIYIKK